MFQNHKNKHWITSGYIAIIIFIILLSLFRAFNTIDIPPPKVDESVPEFNRIYLSHVQTIEIIKNELKSEGIAFQYIESETKLFVTILPSGNPDYAFFEYRAELLFELNEGRNIALVITPQKFGRGGSKEAELLGRTWLTDSIQREFFEQHEVVVDFVIYTLAPAAWTEDEYEEWTKIVYQDLENQVQNLIEQMQFESR